MSLLCPIDFRYGRPKMKSIFVEEARLQRLLEVEAALARAEAKVGLVPREAAAEITKKATTKQVTVRRVEELEKQTRHDLMAVVLALTEACSGDAGKYVHLGATSNDIQDSATALQIRDAIRVLDEDLAGLIDALADLAMKHKKTIMLGRTHGQAAVPITFGLKMAVFASEVARQRERLREVGPRIVVGKMSGAVGGHHGAGGRGSLGRAGTEEQRGLADLAAGGLRPDRRDAGAHDGSLPDPPRVPGPHEGEPRRDQSPGHGGGRDDGARRQGP